MPGPVTSVFEPVLGTRLALRLTAATHQALARAEDAVLAECDRLEDLLSAYRPDSAWNQWRDGRVDTPAAEVSDLLHLAARWHALSGGAFNPQVGVLRARWLHAVVESRPPAADELAALAAGITDLPYQVTDDGRLERHGDCSHLDLHAIAKGWVADRAAAVALAVDGVSDVVVNLGGDLRHAGDGDLTVRIEDPRTPWDNAPPLATVQVGEGGVATGSGARRPMQVGAMAYSHVLDPRTGQPVAHTSSATVLAADAATADVLATVTGVLQPDAAVAWIETVDGAAVLLLDHNGRVRASNRWPA